MARPNQQYATRSAVVLTVLAEEYQAVRAHIRDLRERVDSRGTIYEIGLFDTTNGPWQIALARIGIGNVAAASATERAVFEFKPAVLLMIGIAGGVGEEVALGDVVVATGVHLYESGKVLGEFIPGTPIRISSHRLQQRAIREAERGAWLKRRIDPQGDKRLPLVHLGTIASGEKVIATRTRILAWDRKVLAVEMESYGVLTALRDTNVDALIVRGVADLLDGSKHDDWRRAAATNASAFAFEVLARLEPEIEVPKQIKPPKEKLARRYIAQLNIDNFRSIAEINWHFDAGPGWHVLIGDNGAGKTTVLRAVALALLSRRETDLLVEDWNNWLPPSCDAGRIAVTLASSAYPAPIERSIELIRVTQQGSQTGSVQDRGKRREGPAEVFSVGYGPFRRFSGGDSKYERRMGPGPRLLRSLTLFNESAALTSSLQWLKDLRFKQLEERAESELLEDVKGFINASDLLPQGARLSQVSSEAVKFVDPFGREVEINDLSDGFRSMLSLVLDVVRHMATAYGPRAVFSRADPGRIAAAGILLIDEVDVHLHPMWQHRIGEWFREHFPAVQFIVATHSILICQSADTVFLLPRPGSSDKGRMLAGVELDRIRYGNVLDAYSTGVFGQGVDRSEESKRLLIDLANLNKKELEEDLTPREQAQQEHLRAILPTATRPSRGEPRG